MPRSVLTEARPEARVVAEAGPGRRQRIELITPGWGASAYYPAEVLEAAGNAGVFPAGTHMYLDHRRGDGSRLDERGNRSVRDLAAVLSEAAFWDPTAGEDGTGALVAESTVFAPYSDLLGDKDFTDNIGVSVVAVAEVEVGTIEGRRGSIVRELVEGRSCDFVTRAGRGGRIVQILESAGQAELTESRNIGQWIESRIHRDFTITADDMAGDGRLTREERIGLSSAIGDALAAFVARLEADQPQLYTRDLWEDPQDTIAAAIEAAASDDPVTRPGEHHKEHNMPEISESELTRLRGLEESAGRVTTLESERDAAVQRAETAESERDSARGENAQLRARDAAVTHARTRVTEANGDLAPATVDRIVTTATATVPLTESGQLDTAALDTAVDAARTAEEAYLAGLAESAGAGTVRSFGKRTKTTDQDEVSESDVAAEIRRRAGTEQKGA